MSQSTKKELAKFLKQATKEELEQEIKLLYQTYKAVKNHYKTTFTPQESLTLDSFKALIRKEYFTKKGIGKGRNNISNQVIADFKQLSATPKEKVTLLLYRTEVMIEFADKTGDKNEAFYNSLTRSFDEACRIIAAERLEEPFKTPCEDLLNDAHSIGWGVYDAMQYSFDQVM